MFGFVQRLVKNPKTEIAQINERSYDDLIQTLVDECACTDPSDEKYQTYIDMIDTLNKAKVELTEANAKARPLFDWGTVIKCVTSAGEVTAIMVFEYSHVIASRNALTRAIKI